MSFYWAPYSFVFEGCLNVGVQLVTSIGGNIGFVWSAFILFVYGGQSAQLVVPRKKHLITELATY